LEGGSTIEFNSGGGVVASGAGTTLHLDGAVVQENGGAGVLSRQNAEVLFENIASTGVIAVLSNEGGLDANSGARIDAGTCETLGAPCPSRNVHLIEDNGVVGPFDARARNAAVVLAEGNDWEVDDVGELELVEEGGGIVEVCPIVGGTCDEGGRLAGGGEGAAPRSGGVLALVEAAERAYLAGDMAAFELAALAVVTAVDTATVEDERAAAFEAASRLFAWAQPAAPVAQMAALADEPGESQPWARRALAVAHFSAGGAAGYAEAGALSDTLAAAYAGSEHGRFGLALAVRVAVAEGDEGGALSALAALWAGYPEAEEGPELAALVEAAFPEADVSGALSRVLGGGASGRFTSPTAAPAASAAHATAAEVLLVGEARPNPSSSGVLLPFELGAGANVEAVRYDALGRRVAVLASGSYAAGRHALALDGAVLPAGVYVVYVAVRPGADIRAAVAVRRVTITH
jgi:hypothetical protein